MPNFSLNITNIFLKGNPIFQVADTNNFKQSQTIIYSPKPCFLKTFPAVCAGFIPIPSSVMIVLPAAETINSAAANFKAAVYFQEHRVLYMVPLDLMSV